jgi:uncharacterized protein YecT (DUF1311 family)
MTARGRTVSLSVALALCSTAAAHADSLHWGSTVEMQACLQAKIDEANARLAKYLATAQARIDKDFGSRPDLKAAQAAWVRYRELECGDLYQFWAQGTYRVLASAQCELRLTRQRTHEVWRAYLTYMDSTPPLLPEPRP